VRSSNGAEPKASMRPVLWFGGCFLAVVAALAATVGVVVWLKQWLADTGQPVENVGVVGDMFGIANALFSGLAFAGLIVVLVYEMRERRTDLSHRLESRRPVLSVRFDDDGTRLATTQATVSRAQIDERLEIDLRIDVSVAIESLADVALHPAVSLALSIEGNEYFKQEEEIGLPIVADGHRTVDFLVQLGGRKGRELLEAMRNSSGVRMHIALRYGSVSEVIWCTIVEADIRVALDDKVSAGKVLVNEGFVGKGLSGALTPALKTDIIADARTWQHGRADELKS
jgi:hypothetical protein